MKSGPAVVRTPATELVEALRIAIGAVLRGKERVVDLALAAVLAEGHLLLEDVPGVGKTTLAASLAAAVGGRFSRVQFTSDLLPSDLTGVNVLEDNAGGGRSFAFHPGPIFANVVLADEINRTSPRTQSALFEAMQERCVTVDGHTHTLPEPYLVVATQNPFDFHGTFPLPDSQLDRFLMRIAIGYPSREEERTVLRQCHRRPLPDALAGPAELSAAIAQVEQVAVPGEVEDYMLDLVRATRSTGRLARGVSPRGAQALFRACRAWALLRGRGFVIPEDVRELAVPVLAHRVIPRGGGADPSADAQVAILDVLDRMAPPG